MRHAGRQGVTMQKDQKFWRDWNWFDWIKNGAAVIAAVGGALGVLWGGLMLFSPIGKTDLTVRTKQEIPISLPAGVGPLPIRLVYQDRDITRASIVQLEILNSGSEAIGDDKGWKLDLKSNDGTILLPLGTPRLNPENLSFRIAEGAAPDVVVLDIGLFNPKDTIELEILLLDPKDRTIISPETRVRGLHQLTAGRYNVQQRLRDAFRIPVFIVVFIALFGLIMYERVMLKRRGGEIAFAHTIIGGFILCFIMTVPLTLGITSGLAWIAVNVPK
jgi:hypothetical protein